MPMSGASGPQHVLKVSGPIVIEWPDGTRIRIGPAAGTVAAVALTLPKGKAGRKPSPATATLISAMSDDARAGRQRSRAEYLETLVAAGHTGSAASAGMIVNREAKRTFGGPLGRGKKKAKKGRRSGAGGRQPSPATMVLRARLQADKANGQLLEPGRYVRWVVDQPGVKLGLKQARPIVYRELRAVQ